MKCRAPIFALLDMALTSMCESSHQGYSGEERERERERERWGGGGEERR